MARPRQTHCLRGHKLPLVKDTEPTKDCYECSNLRVIKHFNFDEIITLIKEGISLQEAAVKLGSTQRKAYAWRVALSFEQKAILDKYKVRKKPVVQTQAIKFKNKKWKKIEYPVDYLPTLVPGSNNLLLKAGA